MSFADIHIENTNGSCLSATIRRAWDSLNARVSSVTESTVVLVDDAIGDHLNVRCSIVCSLAQVVRRLNVSPSEIQWITDDIGVFFDVESNVDWIVTTD